VTLYCFDTSVLIDMWHDRYPIDIFAPVWDGLDAAVKDGCAMAPAEVLRELKEGADGLYEWARQRRDLFIEEDEELVAEATAVVRDYPNLIDAGKTGPDADPWVVALAHLKGCTVVTHEKKTGLKQFGMNKSRVRIPDVCDFMRIPRATVPAFLRSRGVALGAP